MPGSRSPRENLVLDSHDAVDAGPPAALAPTPPPAFANAPGELQPKGQRKKQHGSVYAEDIEDDGSEDWSGNSVEDSVAWAPERSSRRTAEPNSSRARPTRRHQRHPEWAQPLPEFQHDAAASVQGHVEHARSYGGGIPPYGYQHPHFAPHARQNSYPSATLYSPHPPPPNRHRSNPYPAAVPTDPFNPGLYHAPTANGYSAYGFPPANQGFNSFSGAPYAANKDPYSLSYPSDQYSEVSSGNYYPPRAGSYGGSYSHVPTSRRHSQTRDPQETRKMKEDFDSLRKEPYLSRVEQAGDRGRAQGKLQEDAERHERRGREEARRSDLERLVKQQVKAEMRKRMQRRKEPVETQSDLGRGRLDWENKLLLENAVRSGPGNDNQSLSSRGSRKDADSEQLLLEIRDLIEEKVRETRERRSSEASGASLDGSVGQGMELATREPRELVSRAEVQDIILDALRNLRMGDGQEAESVSGADDRAISPSSPSPWRDEARQLQHLPPVPQPPDSGRVSPSNATRQTRRDRQSDMSRNSRTQPSVHSRSSSIVPPIAFDQPRHTPAQASHHQTRSTRPRTQSTRKPPSPELVLPSSENTSSDTQSDEDVFSPRPPPQVPNPPVQMAEDISPGMCREHSDGKARDRRRTAPPARASRQRPPREAGPEPRSQGRRRVPPSYREPDLEDSSDEDFGQPATRPVPRVYTHRAKAAPPPLAPDPPPATAPTAEFEVDRESRRPRRRRESAATDDPYEEYNARFDDPHAGPRRRRQSAATDNPYEDYNSRFDDPRTGPRFVPNPMAPRRRY